MAETNGRKDPMWDSARKKLGEQIRRRRKKLGWTQVELAQRAGSANQAQISHTEDGKTGLTVIAPIATALGLVVGIDALEPGQERAVAALPDQEEDNVAVRNGIAAIRELWLAGDREAFRLIMDLMGVAGRLDRNAREALWHIVSDPLGAVSFGHPGEVEEEPSGH